MDIEVGSIYKVDRSKLPTLTSTIPPSLSSISAVLVDAKSDEDVTVLFPSNESLKRFFNNDKHCSGLMQPNLDEKFAMSLNFSEKILAQKIPFEEFAAQRGTQVFWAVDSDHHLDDHDEHHHHQVDDHQRSSSSSAGTLEIQWGRRRRATFSGKHRRVIKAEPPAAIAKTFNNEDEEDEEKDDQEDEHHDDDDDRDNDDDYDANEDDKDEIIPGKSRTLRKRKCQLKVVKYTEKTKKKRKQVKSSSHHDEKKPINNPQHRWTSERYKLAETNMLKIMKAKGAVPGNPILRPELRAEARKLIGDTGLLDHLLKHMAGKLAPGGRERFRRRHNPEGAMEYWLESADLVEIRKKAGIKDQYWTPPPGWKPGDSPTQDPVCAREIKGLKEEVANMKREIEKLKWREKAKNDEALMAATTAPDAYQKSCGRLSFDQGPLLKPLKQMYEDLMKKKAHVEKQLVEMSHSLSGMEEDMEKVKGLTQVVGEDDDDETKDEDEDNLAKSSSSSKRNGDYPINEDDHELQIITPQQKQTQIHSANTATDSDSSDEEADILRKRQRLNKSAFTICKPQGTFLWPADSSSLSLSSTTSQVVVHLQDLLPPAPSLSSSDEAAGSVLPDFHHQVVVKRPVAKRAAVTLTISTATVRGSTIIESISSPNTTTASCSSSTAPNPNPNHQSFVPDLNQAPPPSIISSLP